MTAVIKGLTSEIEGKQTAMNTFKAEFDGFVRQVYPGGMGKGQALQVEAAFYAGGLMAYKLCHEAGQEETHELSAKALDGLHDEIVERIKRFNEDEARKRERN